jgi:hypothetical protein
MLEPGLISTLAWFIGRERTGEISTAQANGVCLLYDLTSRDGAKTSINEFVPFAYTAGGMHYRSRASAGMQKTWCGWARG